jgi:hypothetical protein
MSKATGTKSPNTHPSNPLSLDEIEDLWIVVEEAMHSSSPKLLRAGLHALETIMADNDRRRHR